MTHVAKTSEASFNCILQTRLLYLNTVVISFYTAHMCSIYTDFSAGIPRISFEEDSYTVDESDDYVEVCFFTNSGHTEAIDVEIAPVMKGVDAPAASKYFFVSIMMIIRAITTDPVFSL